MKTKLTGEQYQKISDEARYAKMLLENKNFSFIRDYLQNALTYVEQSILNNTIKEVHETNRISDFVSRVFITHKQEQIDELRGQYKFINKFLQDLQYYVSSKEELDKQMALKQVLVEGQEDKKDETYV